jgi:hypothetical protein
MRADGIFVLAPLGAEPHLTWQEVIRIRGFIPIACSPFLRPGGKRVPISTLSGLVLIDVMNERARLEFPWARTIICVADDVGADCIEAVRYVGNGGGWVAGLAVLFDEVVDVFLQSR